MFHQYFRSVLCFLSVKIMASDVVDVRLRNPLTEDDVALSIKPFRTRQNASFSKQKSKRFLGRGTDPGASIPPKPRRYSPTTPFSLPSHPPFPSLPLFPSPSPPIPSCREVAPLKPASGGALYKLPQWSLGQSPSRHRLWCILRGKKSFDNNYYMDFCILKFVKLLIKSPKLSLAHLSPQG